MPRQHLIRTIYFQESRYLCKLTYAFYGYLPATVGLTNNVNLAAIQKFDYSRFHTSLNPVPASSYYRQPNLRHYYLPNRHQHPHPTYPQTRVNGVRAARSFISYSHVYEADYAAVIRTNPLRFTIFELATIIATIQHHSAAWPESKFGDRGYRRFEPHNLNNPLDLYSKCILPF